MRAGLVINPGDYPRSSFKVHSGGESDGITDVNKILLGEFGSSESYRSFVCTCTDREEQDLQTRMARGIIGEDSFCVVIAEGSQAARQRRRGRPLKNDS